jgi:hypothetical protein
MELQAPAALNIGRASLNIVEVVWQTVFVSPDARALPTLIESPITVFESSASLFSSSAHDITGACSLHPASKSGTMTRQGIAGNLRIVPSGCDSRLSTICAGVGRAQIVGECQDRTANPKKALARLVNAVFPNSDKMVVGHRVRRPKERHEVTLAEYERILARMIADAKQK